MKKIEELKKMVLENGTEKMVELVAATELYLGGLDRVFAEREVTKMVLMEIDFPLFISELEENGIFQNKSGTEIKFLLMNIQEIARNIWELTDKYGKIKNGDDLHTVDPLMFGGETMRSVEDIYEDLPYY